MKNPFKKLLIAYCIGAITVSIPWYFYTKKLEKQLNLTYLGLANSSGIPQPKHDTISYEKILADEAIKNKKVIKNEPEGTLDKVLETTENLLKNSRFDKYNGREVPGFAYADSNGKLIDIDDFRGKWVLIDVWASWCKPCMGDIDLMKNLEKKLENENIIFLGVSIDSESMKDRWLNVLQRRNPAGIQILAGSKADDFKKKFLIETVPRYILIDKNGKIAKMNLPRPYDPEMENIINKHLKN